MKLPIKLPQKATKLLGKIFLKTKQASPEICVIGGIICSGAALVMVGVKTWKNKDELSTRFNDIQESKNATDEEVQKLYNDDKMTAKKALARTRLVFVKEVGKTYWIPTLLGLSSVGLIWGGRTMLRKELSAVTSAYALLMESYKQYRQRVIDDVGIEKDQEYMHGIKMVDAVDSETGEVTRKAIVDRDKSISQYAAWFCEGEFDGLTGEWLWRNAIWRDNPLLNENTLKCIQNAANDQLKAYGFIFLNDVRKMLGLPPTREGQIVGWTLNGGDGYIDFGLFPIKSRPFEKLLPVNQLFLDHRTPNALLDFNVDGPILGVLDKAFGKDYADKLVHSGS